jgi:predicted CXXCH cytochrome family protein
MGGGSHLDGQWTCHGHPDLSYAQLSRGVLLRHLCQKLNLFRIPAKSSPWQGTRLEIALLVVMTGLVSAVPCGAAEQRQVNKLPEPVIEANPHWRDDACNACHIGNADTKQPQLKDKNINQLCLRCHDPISNHSYIHPVDVKPDAKMISRMPADYKDSLDDSNGKISCSTCHDIPIQCLAKRRSEKSQNPSFFRGGPYRERSEQCYFCHDARQYERLNPHEQLTKGGQLREATCRICHTENMQTLQAIHGIENLKFNNNTQDISAICTRCHVWKPHPGGSFTFNREKTPPNHLVKPNTAMLQYMQNKFKHTNLTPLLEPVSAKVTCATCHDPHEQGVIKDREVGIDEKTGKPLSKFLRTKEICLNCHDK